MNTLHISDAYATLRSADSGSPYVELWRVRGIPLRWYPSKTAAEVAARVHFPDEDPDTRYGRLSFKWFIAEDSL